MGPLHIQSQCTHCARCKCLHNLALFAHCKGAGKPNVCPLHLDWQTRLQNQVDKLRQTFSCNFSNWILLIIDSHPVENSISLRCTFHMHHVQMGPLHIQSQCTHCARCKCLHNLALFAHCKGAGKPNVCPLHLNWQTRLQNQMDNLSSQIPASKLVANLMIEKLQMRPQQSKAQE